MLQAVTSRGERVTLMARSQKEIENLRQSSTFYCPVCHQAVFIKAGSHVTPHFAHYQTTECPTTGKGEGPYHEKGKIKLYHWLKKQGLHVELEKYLTNIQQQPDLFVTIQKKRIAIEFQCAKVSAQELLDRQLGYERDGITSIWILGANRFTRTGPHTIKIDTFIQQLIHQFSSQYPTQIYFFCPHQEQFAIFQDIYFPNRQKAIGNLSFIPLQKCHLLSLFHRRRLSLPVLKRIWLQEMRHFRLKHRNFFRGQQREWLMSMYEQQLTIDHLPSITYLPLINEIMMKRPAWEWQSTLFVKLLTPLSIGQIFKLQDCYDCLKALSYPKNHFPLIRGLNHPVQNYLKQLARLKIVEQRSPTRYQKILHVKRNEHIESSLEKDLQIMNKLFGSEG